ncbi:hypothetical protein BHF71_08965 [Vulcanibacillus modesticaldus]|uniref:Uncharacterized protein n=1 Tax=Vulcanibacillus modesticaldus TaxID=337097 RepID=A0A1D2YUU9_9BACI|nr:hypothetical protein [Vulcanibacillus modesticaldus]OEF99484.1 hypothetical protein BHF71_08965 [Vulcanibacillus modesticaldus]
MKKHLLFVLIITALILIVFVTNANEKKLNFEVLFDGMITFDESLGFFPPNEIIVFTSKEGWEDFGNKYLPNHYKKILHYISYIDKKIDFSNEYVIYYSNGVSPKSFFDGSSHINNIILKNNELDLEYSRDRGSIILNELGIKHPYIFIGKLNKEDIPIDLINIYKEDKDYVPYD